MDAPLALNRVVDTVAQFYNMDSSSFIGDGHKTPDEMQEIAMWLASRKLPLLRSDITSFFAAPSDDATNAAIFNVSEKSVTSPLLNKNLQMLSALIDEGLKRTPGVTVKIIQDAVSRKFKITMPELLGERRARDIARPRQIGMYLSKTMTGRSLPDIGRRFGNRDHTTVLHAVRRVEQLIKEDDDFALTVESTKLDVLELARPPLERIHQPASVDAPAL